MKPATSLYSYLILLVIPPATIAGEVITDFADVNGTKLYYEFAGSGQAVVLVHGFTLDTRMWDDQFSILSQNYRVIRYDQRGHGQSDGIRGNAALYEDLQSLLDFLEIQRAHVVGLSLGGTVAADFAVLYPQRVRSLTLMDALVSG